MQLGQLCCRGDSVWPSPGPTLGLEREPSAGDIPPKPLPQQEKFTAHDICTVQKDGTVTITNSEKKMKEKRQNFSEMKIIISPPYTAYENVLKIQEKL